MDTLYAPWRTAYSKRVEKKIDEHKDGCVFCHQINSGDDDTYWILRHYDDCVIMLNKYPYNPGHILILPKEHIGKLSELSPQTRARIMELASASVDIFADMLENHGANVGVNLGKAAGAGLPGHLHVHVVPRWHNDSNFLPVIAGVKQISVDMQKIYEDLKPRFAAITI